jgi:hypothetical protein
MLEHDVPSSKRIQTNTLYYINMEEQPIAWQLPLPIIIVFVFGNLTRRLLKFGHVADFASACTIFILRLYWRFQVV